MAKTSSAGARTKAAVIEAGLALWRQNAKPATIRQIGDRIAMTHAAILYHFKSADNLQDVVARRAVELRDSVIVPQLLVMKHPAVADLAEGERMIFLMGC